MVQSTPIAFDARSLTFNVPRSSSWNMARGLHKYQLTLSFCTDTNFSCFCIKRWSVQDRRRVAGQWPSTSPTAECCTLHIVCKIPNTGHNLPTISFCPKMNKNLIIITCHKASRCKLVAGWGPRPSTCPASAEEVNTATKWETKNVRAGGKRSMLDPLFPPQWQG